MKEALRAALQRVLGLDHYLVSFALFRLAAARVDLRDAAFRHFLSLIPCDATVLDVGANVGWTTVLLAWRARRVHAFEPIPGNHRALCRVTELLRLRNVVIHKMAVGNHDGTVGMVTPVTSGGVLHGLSHVLTVDRPAEAGPRFVVECRRLDGLAGLFAGERIGAVKMDVEGAESDVIEGARELFRAHKPALLCELWRSENRRRAIATLGELGYEACALENGVLVPFDTSRHDHYLDFIFLPRGSLE